MTLIQGMDFTTKAVVTALAGATQ